MVSFRERYIQFILKKKHHSAYKVLEKAARVKLFAELLSEKIEPLDFNREHCSYLAEVPYEKNVDEKKKSEKVLLISTGHGISIGS